MNKYPGIYRAEDGGEYIYDNKDSYYCFLRGLWDKSDPEDNHENDKNITAEYLVNTKVKIESEEHEVFVREIASSANLKCAVLNDFAFIFDNFIEDADKQITIPLPPKDKSMESQKERPQVGDYVICKSKADDIRKGELLALTKKYAIVEYDGFEHSLHLGAWEIEKSISPEEELESEVSKIIKKKHAELIGGPITSEMIGAMACNAAEILIKHFDIKKKPE